MSKRILIVDDDQGLVAPLKEGLESVGYRVSVAFDGLQGVLQAHQAKPDAIILDFQMPGGGGHTVYERLRSSPDTAGIPVIFSSVISADEIRSRVKPGPNTFFLRKPMGLGQFIAILNSVLGLSVGAAPEEPFSPVPPPPAVRPTLAPAPAKAEHAPQSHRGHVKPAKVRFHEFNVRVTYADTDKMGVIYYANYLRYFEQGRVELLRSLGVRYRDLEVQRKLFIPVVETGCRYLAASRYDDLLAVRTCITDMGKASITFKYLIFDEEGGRRKVADGFTRHAVVNDLWRAVRVPEDLRKLLEPFVGEMPA
ncbi:MAG: YbgC/FadM family acyl-CoA thioesterase [Elusimicrobia bacterium]|nr:YbgC/FadM family acyl-CoA thioesterase [Elusimicrobiota bacterium]